MELTKLIGLGFLLLLLVFSFGCVEEPAKPGENVSAVELKKFNSSSELKTFLSLMTISGGYRNYDTVSAPLSGGIMPAMQTLSAMPKAEADSSSDFSTTNIQVEGVDEADIVKSDGKYLYVLSGEKLVIVDAYPAENARILSETDINNPIEIYVNGDDLVVFSSDYSSTRILQYDMTDRTSPALEKDLSVEGSYFNSRMIGKYVYAIVNKPVYYYGEGEIEPPMVKYAGSPNTSEFPDIYYFDEPSYSYRFTTVLSLDLASEVEQHESKIFLMGTSQDIYVSQENIYVTYQKIPEYVILRSNPAVEAASNIVPMPPVEYTDETAIHRIAIEDGEIKYAASGSVPGQVLNQFSMDEHNGYFRIATTTGHLARSAGEASSKNHIYTLDPELNTVGKLEDLAPGEKIYSARFMGDRAYLVTFRKVDPLFVIDMEDPTDLKILGKLKIPGYSDYLHPYDENHLIGIGKETVAAEEGDFSWYQGVKISLFDVSDVSKPKEVAKYEIGDRGTDSYALHEHKAFLFSRSKNLLILPITLAEIDEEKYPQGLGPTTHGEYTFQGAYVFDISTEGITLKGRIGHVDDPSVFEKAGYYYYSPYSVKRSMYMDNVLYTISDKKIKMNSLDDLDELNSIELPYKENNQVYYIE